MIQKETCYGNTYTKMVSSMAPQFFIIRMVKYSVKATIKMDIKTVCGNGLTTMANLQKAFLTWQAKIKKNKDPKEET